LNPFNFENHGMNFALAHRITGKRHVEIRDSWPTYGFLVMRTGQSAHLVSVTRNSKDYTCVQEGSSPIGLGNGDNKYIARIREVIAATHR